jgi:centrin-1
MDLKLLRESFDLFDVNGNGVIAAPELKLAMRQLGFAQDTNDIPEILRVCGTQNKGGITFEDFVNLLTVGITEDDPQEEISKSF